METPGRFTMNHRDSMMLAEDISAFGGSQVSIEGAPRLLIMDLNTAVCIKRQAQLPEVCYVPRHVQQSMLFAGQLQAGIAVTIK